MHLDPHNVADAAAAIAVTRNDQAQRMPLNRLAVPAVGEQDLLTLKIRVDLGQRQRGSIAVAPGDQDYSAQLRAPIAAQHFARSNTDQSNAPV